jgi:tRNA pseudouridine55 synthase
MVTGILNINKSVGRTSFSVVAAVKKLCRERHVGHTGTLDPMAEGVLPVCLGRATRVAEYLLDSKKAYRAVVEFGMETDTGDAEGKMISHGDVSGLNREKVLSVLGDFRGRIMQTPPMYSALKHNGRPLYKYAREGIVIERKSRIADIFNLEILSWDTPVVVLDITCSHGTYIRSLAVDLGRTLGCGAYLKSLKRLRCGPFDISAALTLDALEEAVQRGDWQAFLFPVDSVLQDWPVLNAGAEMADAIRHGRPVVYPEIVSGGGLSRDLCRAYSLDGSFLGVLRFNSETGEWQPKKIFL